jgi:hypothetical protein
MMKTLYPVLPDPRTDPVYLAAAAVHSLIQPLPSGTAFCIGVVLMVRMTGRLVQTKGSLARAVLPFVVHRRWGWHRVERAMERGTCSLDALFDLALDWCLRQVPVEPVRLGTAQREVNAIDSSTIARLRAGPRLALAGKGYCHRAGRAVRAHLVAALTTGVMREGVRVGLVRRTRFGARCAEAVARVFADVPPAQGQRLLVVDAGIATQEQLAAATAQDALLGRLRINVKRRCAPPPRRANPGVARCTARCCILGARSLRWRPTWIGTSWARRGSSGGGGGICCTMRRLPTSAWMWCGLMTRPTTNRGWWAPRPLS